MLVNHVCWCIVQHEDRSEQSRESRIMREYRTNSNNKLRRSERKISFLESKRDRNNSKLTNDEKKTSPITFIEIR